MTQTRSRHRAPMLNAAQIGDIAAVIAAFPPPPPMECRLHPDDWDHVRAVLPATAKGVAQVSIFADVGMGSPSGRLTELRIVIDADAPRLPRTGARP